MVKKFLPGELGWLYSSVCSGVGKAFTKLPLSLLPLPPSLPPSPPFPSLPPSLPPFIAGDDGSASTSTRESSASPTPSSGAVSLGQEEEGGATAADGPSKAMESKCRELLGLVDELKWYHEQVNVTA